MTLRGLALNSTGQDTPTKGSFQNKTLINATHTHLDKNVLGATTNQFPPFPPTHTPTHKLSNYLLMSSIILTSSFRLFSLLLLASLLGICFCGSALWVESLAEFSGPTATKLFQYNLRPKERAIFISYFNQATIQLEQ